MKMRIKIIALGIVLVLVLLASAAVSTASALSNSGGGSWAYYKEITVRENSGKTLTDYQVLVELNSANFDFSKAKSDGSDIRFSLNGEELNYWIEEWNLYAKKAKIRVKVPHIPANGEVKIKMYYENPSASAVSDGDKVFEYFDDFEDGDYTDKWSLVKGVATEENGYLEVGSTSAIEGLIYVKTKTFSDTTGFIIEGKINQITSNDLGEIMFHNDGTANNYYIFVVGYQDELRICKRVKGRETCPAAVSQTINENQWYDFKVKRNPDGTIKGEIIGINSVFLIDNSLTSGYVGVRVGGTADDKVRIDNYRVRKYASLEPTITLSAEYPVVRTALTLRKSVSPYSIKQGQKANVIITVENAGTTTLYDIEVVDAPPAEFEFVSGDTSAKYTALKPGESRTFSYVIKSVSAGKFDLGKAKATYADEEGNYHTVESNAPMIEVLAPLITPEIPSEEKKIPGFEIVSALAALFAVARMRGRRRK